MRGIFSVLVLLVAGAASAQPSGDANTVFYKAYAERSFETNSRLLAPVLTLAERVIQDQTRIVIKDEGLGATASSMNNELTINVSADLISAADIVANTLAIMGVQGLPNEGSDPYFTDLATALRGGVAARVLGQTPPILPHPATYFGVSRQTWNTWMLGAEVRQRQETLMQHAMALIYAHELGHHVLGHLATERGTPQQETEADEWAMRKVVLIDIRPMWASQVFVFYAALEGNSTTLPDDPTHPLSICRANALVQFDTEYLLTTPSMRDRLSREDVARLREMSRVFAKGTADQGIVCE